MLRYETLFLSIPELTSDEFSAIESSVNKTLHEFKGSMISCERWGKFRLAYPIKKNDYGIYGLVRFEIEPVNKDAVLNALKTLFTIKHGDSIMRHMTVSLDPKLPLAYHRPESLEEVPLRDVDTFLKENKMEGLITKRSLSKSVHEELEEEIEETDDLSEPTDTYLGDKTTVAATPPSEGN
jgi:small subunit ribosomal protein S6